MDQLLYFRGVRKRQHYARPGHVSFDERSHKRTTVAVDRFERLGVEGSYYFIDQLAASVAGGRDGGSMARKGVLKERLLQIVSVTTQVAISRRVSRFKLQLRDRQDATRSEGGGDHRLTHGIGMECGRTRSGNLKGMVIGYTI